MMFVRFVAGCMVVGLILGFWLLPWSVLGWLFKLSVIGLLIQSWKLGGDIGLWDHDRGDR